MRLDQAGPQKSEEVVEAVAVPVAACLLREDLGAIPPSAKSDAIARFIADGFHLRSALPLAGVERRIDVDQLDRSCLHLLQYAQVIPKHNPVHSCFSRTNTNVPLVSVAATCIVLFGLLNSPAMSANRLIYAMLTHRGRVRHGNEDTCAAAPEAGAFVVCDGMGGAAAGEIASTLAADTFLANVTPASRSASHGSEPEARLNAAIQAANQ